MRFVQQAVAGAKTDKLRTVEQILSPIPIMPEPESLARWRTRDAAVENDNT